MMDWLTDAITEPFRNFAKSGLDMIVKALNNSSGNIEESAGNPASSFNAGIYEMMREINSSVMLPVAGVVLTYVAFMELYNLFVSRNNMNDIGMEQFFKWLLKTSIAVLLVTKAFDIVNTFFSLGGELARRIGVVVRTNDITSQTPDFSEFVKELNFGEALGIGIISYVAALGMFIIGILSYVYVISWVFECYLMASTSSIPMATLGTDVTTQMGQNYLKNIFALALQGGMFLTIITIYRTLMNGIAFNITNTDGIWSAIGIIVVPGIVMVMLMAKAGQVAKAAIGAV